MDGFMEKIAHKFGSGGDVSKANSEADAKALKEARSNVKALEAGIEEMKRLSHKCAEINELTEQLAKGAIERLEETEPKVVTEENLAVSATPAIDPEIVERLKAFLDRAAEEKQEQTGAVSEDLKELMESSFKEQAENVHQENVRVYRNVQAALVDELKQQSEAIAIEHVHMEKKLRGIKPLAILALVFSGIGMCSTIAVLLILMNVIQF